MIDTALEAVQKFVEEEERRLGIVRVPAPRDYVPCKWCGGGSVMFGPPGCAACYNARVAKKKKVDEEYARQFPDGPKPFFEARLDSPEEMEAAKRVVGAEALEKAFGPGGRGMEEVLENAARENERLGRNQEA